MHSVTLEVITYEVPSVFHWLKFYTTQGVAVRINEAWVICLNGGGVLKYQRYAKLKVTTSTYKKINNKQWKVLNEWLADAAEREVEFKNNKDFLELLVKML